MGNRVAHEQTNAPWDLVSSQFYKSCSPIDGASTPAGFANPAAYCNQNLPNPFQGLAPFLGTSLYTNSTISLNQSTAPSRNSTAGLSTGSTRASLVQLLQINYTHRVGHGLTMNANYTGSKQIER